MSDLISREEVLALPRNTTRNFSGEVVNETIDVDLIEQLPSAEPERRDCGWTGIDDDYPVSIREVIDITAETGALTTQSRVMELKPYKLSERKTGRWIIHHDWIADGECGYECSECGRCYDYDMNYCGYCGAKMEVEHEAD